MGRFTHRGINASGSCSGERGNILSVVTNSLPYAGASAPTEGGEGRVHIVAAARLQLDKLTLLLQYIDCLLGGRRQTVPSCMCSSAVASPSDSVCESERSG